MTTLYRCDNQSPPCLLSHHLLPTHSLSPHTSTGLYRDWHLIFLVFLEVVQLFQSTLTADRHLVSKNLWQIKSKTKNPPYMFYLVKYKIWLLHVILLFCSSVRTMLTHSLVSTWNAESNKEGTRWQTAHLHRAALRYLKLISWSQFILGYSGEILFLLFLFK